MDIERLNGIIPPEISEPLAEAAPAAGGPMARQIPAPGAGETGAMATPSHDPGLISATPMPLPGPNLEGPGQPGPVTDPVALRGETPPVMFLDSRLEVATLKGSLRDQLTGPVPGHGAPGSGPRPGSDPGPGGIVFAPGIRAEQDVPPAPPQPDPGPQPDPPDPDPIPEPEGRIFGEGQWGVVTGGAVPMPGPKGGPDPVPVNVMFAPGLRAEQDVPPAPPQPDPEPPPPPPPPDPDPTPPNPELGFLNPGLGPGSMKAQLLQELNTLRAETPETLSPGNLNRAGDSAGFTDAAGPQKTRIAGDEGH